MCYFGNHGAADDPCADKAHHHMNAINPTVIGRTDG